MNMACHHRHVCTVQKHTPFSVCNRTPSPIWLKCRCFQLPPRPNLERHLGGLACVSRTSPPGVGRLRGSWTAQGPSVLGTLGGTGTSVSYYGEPGVLRDRGSGCLYPFGTGGYPACYQCGVASAQCGGIGSPGAVVPLCQVTLLASFLPRCTTPTIGSLVTPSVCFWTPPPPLCLPVPVCVMCDVTTCEYRRAGLVTLVRRRRAVGSATQTSCRRHARSAAAKKAT